jgi:hypothetical protein
MKKKSNLLSFRQDAGALKKILLLAAFFLFLLNFSTDTLFSQTRAITGRVFRYRYSPQVTTGVKVSLIGPGNQYRTTTTGTINGYDNGAYQFLLLPDGAYKLRFFTNNTYGSFYNNRNPSTDIIPAQNGTSVDSTQIISITINGSNIEMDTIFAKGRSWNISGKVDSTGAFGNAGLKNVWVRANCTYNIAPSGTAKYDTMWTQTDVNGSYTLTGVNAEGNWNFVPCNGKPGTTPFILAINGFPNMAALNVSLLTADVAGKNFDYLISRYLIGGTVTFTPPGGSSSGLKDIDIKISGPTVQNEIITDILGQYSFTNNPTNYFYWPYVITPYSEVYDFTPSSISISPLSGNSNTNNFVAKYKLKTISGICTDGDDPKAGIRVCFDSLMADNSYKKIDSTITDINGVYSSLRTTTGTYKVYAVDNSAVSPLVFYPASVIFENLKDNKTQNFSTIKDRHWISGMVTDITNVLSVPAKNIIIDVKGQNGFSNSAVTGDDGNYAILVPNGDVYSVSPNETKGAVFVPLKIDNISGDNDIANNNFSVEFIVPKLNSPAVNSILNSKSVQMKWYKVSGATSYFVEYSPTPNFSTGLVSLQPSPATDTTILANLPDFNTTYYWRVKAERGSVESDWSEVWNFTTGLDKPVEVSPLSHRDVLSISLNLTWNSVPGATEYEVEVADSATGVVITNQTIASTSLSLNNLTDRKSYSWKVRAKNQGSISDWTDLWYFYILKSQYKISGTIKRFNGGTLSNVVFSLNDGAATTTSNSSGVYEFLVNTNTTNVVTPQLNGYSLNVELPSADSIIYTIRADSTLNFIATPKKFIVTGTIKNYNNIDGLDSTSVTLNNGSNDRKIITSSNGNYQFVISADSVYTVTPEKNGFIFNPGNRLYSYPTNDYSEQNFKAEQNAFIVTGYVKNGAAGLKDVKIEINDVPPGATSTTLTDVSGKYSFTALVGGAYSVKASKNGYTISSNKGNPQLSGSITQNSTLPDFTAVPNNYLIKGKIEGYDGSSGLISVLVTLNNGNSNRSIITDSTGVYTFTVNPDSNYTVTPSKGAYVFNPNNRSYTAPYTDYIDQDFKAELNAYTVTGYVKQNTIGIKDVVICITGNGDNITATDANGKYTFTALLGKTYSVTASKSGYSITSIKGNPQSTGEITSDISLSDFSATPNNYKISGKIKNYDLSNLSGALVSLNNGTNTRTILTINDGKYEFTVSSDSSYNISVSKNGFAFNPTSRSYNYPGADNIDQDYKAELNAFLVTGYVKKSGVGLKNVLINVSGLPSPTTTTDASGKYSFTAILSQNYSVTASRDGYDITSALGNPMPTGTIISDTTLIDFTSTSHQYTVSGKVKDYNNSSPLSGITVILNNGTSSRSIITQADGNYLFTVNSDSNYTITPIKNGYVFNPGNKAFLNPTINYSDQDFKAELNAFTIKGFVRRSISGNPIKSAIINITGSSVFNTLTDDSGKYTFTALIGQSFNVNAGKEGYTLTSISGNPQITGAVIQDYTVPDFIATPKPYSISGYVFDFDGITGLAGVDVTCTGTTPVTIQTDVHGYYAFTVDVENVYTISPNKPGTVLNPNNRVYSNPSADYINQNFSSTQNAFVVDGYVKSGSTPLSEVVIEFTSNQTGSGLTITNTSGYYKFTAISGADYSVHATKAGYSINSVSGNPQSSGAISGNKTMPDFSANLNKYIISGKVLYGGVGLGGITLLCPGADNQTTTSNSTGDYSFTVNALQTYTVTPQYSGYSFTPFSISLFHIESNSAGNNFSAAIDDVPELISPINGAIGVLSNPTLAWKSVTGAASYNLQYSTDYNFATFNQVSNINELNRQLLSLNPQTTYYWRVNASGAGGVSNWSVVWSFRTAGGKIAWSPSSLNYDPTIIGRLSNKKVVITNQGIEVLRLSNITIGGTDKTSFATSNNVPVLINHGESYSIDVNFVPQKAGVLNASLYIDHNDGSTAQNPIEVPLSGTAVTTLVTLNLPNVLDFGTVIFGSGYIEKNITITNNSTIPNDYLNVSSYFFESTDQFFQVITPLPIVLEPGTSYPLTIRFNPDRLGLLTNNLHLLNSSANAPEAKIKMMGSVLQGDLIINPNFVDYGNTTKAAPYKDTLIMVQNNSSKTISILNKNISGDLESFVIVDNHTIKLLPNQTDFIKVRFFPRTGGKKTAKLNIQSDYSFAPSLSVPLTGIGGEEPVINTTSRTIDFGILKRGQIKDTTITIKNEGSLDLVINSKNLNGNDKDLFEILSNETPVYIRGGESYEMKIRASGLLPVGSKEGQLVLISNDPENPNIVIDLLAQVRSSVLIKGIERIDFDTVDVGYHQDSIFVIKNEGDVKAIISSIIFDGPFPNDFSLVETSSYMEIMPGEYKVIKLRFAPLESTLRYARMVFKVNDETEPEQYIILKGWGRNSIPCIGVSGGLSNNDIIDFGQVPVFETRTKSFDIKNLSKFNKLIIDSLFFEYIENQPFYYSNITLPAAIQSGATYSLGLNFNPHDKINGYTALLNIVYRDSMQNKNMAQVIKIKMKGAVVFPGANVKLTPVLKFGKVVKGQTQVASFEVTNLGASYLKIDSMRITGDDASEFNVIDPRYPIKMNTNETVLRSISFNPTKIGSKDAYISIFWNDLFVDGKIEIWAEGVLTGNDVLSVKTNEIPTKYDLRQNYPNPFNPSTMIKFSLPDNSFVSLKIYNSLGQVVETLVNETLSIGTYITEWHAKNIPSGIYFYRLETNKFTSMKKMLLLK